MKSAIQLSTVTFLLFILACGSRINRNEKEKSRLNQDIQIDITGNYVSDSYHQRNEGYDWVSVSVTKNYDNEIFLSVRSRADKKKPTCTFDTKAYKTSDTTYLAVDDGKKIIITFQSNSVHIATENAEDESVLYFYCSGGATVAGTYQKIDQPLDESQTDKTTFSKILRLQNVGFNVSSKPVGNHQELEIYPFGLSLANQSLTEFFEGKIMDAEVEDLNSDGFPEVVVFIQSPNKKGDVIGISVNNENTVSRIDFPPTDENPEINVGYNGEDEFSVVETNLVRRFSLFENGQKTGKIRQIQYKLETDGKMQRFVIKNITEY